MSAVCRAAHEGDTAGRARPLRYSYNVGMLVEVMESTIISLRNIILLT